MAVQGHPWSSLISVPIESAYALCNLGFILPRFRDIAGFFAGNGHRLLLVKFGDVPDRQHYHSSTMR